jgi:hypothetical protein
MSAEWEAPVTSKMSELQEAMNRYGASSVRNYQTVHPIGEKLIEGFGTYLGVAGCVLGVPPTGNWKGDTDYRSAKFSTYNAGRLSVGPISMGLAVRIPHTKDAGPFWMRVVLEFLIEGSAFSVRIGDGKTVPSLPIDCTDSDLHPVYDEIFSYVKDVFVHPVSYFEAERTGKIGFLAKVD